MISDEVKGIIALVQSFGLPHRVTDITGPGHAKGGYHYLPGSGGAGLAVDLAGRLPYTLDPAGARADMLALCRRLEPYEPRLAELICSHLPYSIKDGHRVPRMAVKAHLNHVHLAVPRGTVLFRQPRPVEVIILPDNPDLPNIDGPATFHPIVNTTTGQCTGYYIFAGDTAELHGFGPGAPYFGRSEVIQS